MFTLSRFRIHFDFITPVAALALVMAAMRLDGAEPRQMELASNQPALLPSEAVLAADEKEGYRKFKSYGCTSCHQGVNVGGNMFETLGAMADYFTKRGNVTKADYGRFNVTGRESDRFVFRVPSLRNVALTAPYFHDGSMARLEDAVAAMGNYQLGESLPPADIAQIVQFLKTLTGEFGGKPL